MGAKILITLVIGTTLLHATQTAKKLAHSPSNRRLFCYMYLGTEQADTVPYIVLPRHIPNCSMVNISDEDVQVKKDWSHLSKLVQCRCLCTM